jgi:hypothetical protein
MVQVCLPGSPPASRVYMSPPSTLELESITPFSPELKAKSLQYFWTKQ